MVWFRLEWNEIQRQRLYRRRMINNDYSSDVFLAATSSDRYAIQAVGGYGTAAPDQSKLAIASVRGVGVALSASRNNFEPQQLRRSRLGS